MRLQKFNADDVQAGTNAPLPAPIENSINNAFAGDISVKTDEAPALAPLNSLVENLHPEETANVSADQLQQSIVKAADQAEPDPYAKFIGKGGTIYVHVFYLGETETNIKDEKGNKVSPQKKHYELAAALITEKFQKRLKINLKVKVVFAKKGEKPLNREQFQSRPDYNLTDSYVVVMDRMSFAAWEEEEYDKYKKEGDLPYSNAKAWDPYVHERMLQNTWGPLGVGPTGTSYADGKGVQFYARIDVSEFDTLGETFHYQDAADEFGADKALAMAIAKIIEHETGHHKFDLHPKDDAQTEFQGGHVRGTIMQEYPVYGVSEEYDEYMLMVLYILHGGVPASPIEIKKAFEDWAALSLAEKGDLAWDYLKKMSIEIDFEKKVETDVLHIIKNRHDLPADIKTPAR